MFADITKAGVFLRDYSFNRNKTIFRDGKTEESEKMGVFRQELRLVRLVLRKQPSNNKRSSLVSPVSTGSWYISNLSDKHRNLCTSTVRCSTEQLQELRGFQAAIVEGGESSRERVV